MQLIYDPNWGTGAMPVRWCLDESEQAHIVSEEISAKHLFVVIDLFYGQQPTERWELVYPAERILVPLDKCLQFLSFKRPGVVHVCVSLVCPRFLSVDAEEAHEEMIRALLHKNAAERPSNQLFGFSDTDTGDQSAELTSAHSSDCQCEVISYSHERIEVPKEYFAKPFTGWLAWWVEWIPRELLRRYLIDECDQRRWAFFAFTVQPFVFPVVLVFTGVLISIVFAITSSVAIYYGLWRGYRGVDWKAALRLQDSPSEIRQVVSKHGWSSRYDTDDQDEPRSFARRLVQPAFATLVLGAVLFFTSETEVWQVRSAFLGTIGFVGFLPSLWQMYRELRYQQVHDAQEQRQQQEAAEQKDRTRQLLTDLSCPVLSASAGIDPARFLRIDAVPEQSRTIRLRYEAVKAKVCRPLARR